MVSSPEKEGSERPQKIKFIQTTAGDIYFGNDGERSHREIAENNNIRKSEILGGGFADLASKRLYGVSGEYGRYDPEIIRDSWPDWKLD